VRKLLVSRDGGSRLVAIENGEQPQTAIERRFDFIDIEDTALTGINAINQFGFAMMTGINREGDEVRAIGFETKICLLAKFD
jgi:hypothetical protein